MKPAVRKVLLKIHLYGGLLFFPYLIIFGLSSLHVNHHFGFMEEEQEWEMLPSRHFELQATDDNQVLADAVKDSLGLMGWAPFWEQDRDSLSYDFKIVNFGSEYKVSLDLVKNDLSISRRSKGVGHVLHSLHFLGEKIPGGTALINSWHHYQNLTVFFVLAAAITGIILFLKRKRERTIGLAIASGAFLMSLTYLLYVWLVG